MAFIRSARCGALLLTLIAAASAGQPPAGTPATAPAAQAHQAQELVQQAAALEENPDWAVTLKQIASSVVAIDVDSTRAFDTEWNSTAEATGFVVDAERGLILTNRHVVTPGPVTAEATFLNREEVQLYPVYRDPVHDFGFYRYDPKKLRFIHPKALALYPEGAQVGREIRVVGNNAGEQLSILAGTLARLDRQAPEYGIAHYNDFNTFYLQAASGTSGGSSGSPVIDIRGRVIALNAGGATGAASSFYLPLGRVRRALHLIQQGKPVTRGTVATTFVYTPYDELERLGLTTATEEQARKAFPVLTGMLVVSDVLPGSPSSGVLQPGDILVRVNGRLTTQFEPLEEVLDASVGHDVEVELQRGGKTISAQVPVTDLNAITPDSYLEFGDAVVNTISYQQARDFNVPVRGAYVASPGYVFGSAGVPRGAVITAVDSQPVATVEDMERVIAKLGDGDRGTVRYFTIEEPNGSNLRSFRMDRRWFPARYCKRNDREGIWDCTDVAPAAPTQEVKDGSTEFPRYSDPRLQRLAPSLVLVNYDMPYSVSGVTEHYYHGTGLVVDAQRGLVVVDRNTVPVSVGDVTLTFAGTLQVPARVVYVHPLHNLAVVEYDPKLIGTTPVKSAQLATSDLQTGENVWVVGLTGDSELRSRNTQVASIDPIELPLSRTMRFRDTNDEVADLVNPPLDYDGVLVNDRDQVVGLWSSFAYENGSELEQSEKGVPIDLVAEMLDRIRTGRPLHSLEVELGPIALANAREFGLSDQWLKRLEQHGGTQRQALAAVRLVGGSPASHLLQQGDILLAIDGAVVSRFRDVERAVGDRDRVAVTVWRANAARTLEVPTVELPGSDVRRIVQWAGATLQAPHRPMAAQRGIPPVGVYVAYFAYGSPAARYALYPGRRIIQVDDTPTPDLDAFLAAVSGRADRSSVRLKTVTWNNAAEVITLKLDKHYWPAYQLTYTPAGWERTALE
ncbi:MAG TPA: trypsin-like peptidase domain-containing protein [Steroidobacteraceae bacterium]|nr:trypsin-like peptidase domain-containing protein [Steroidobacteraceae bacterium]HUN74240.1 trypsin-like peptidase domain-containing protein [Steroidobacteraceae bacterium]